jgi:hypothetical protein
MPDARHEGTTCTLSPDVVTIYQSSRCNVPDETWGLEVLNNACFCFFLFCAASMHNTFKETRYILLTGTEFIAQNVYYLLVWLGSFFLSVFYRLGVSSHESRVLPQYRPFFPTPPPPHPHPNPIFNTALPTPIRCQELRHQFSPICSPTSRSSQPYIVLHSDFHEEFQFSVSYAYFDVSK